VHRNPYDRIVSEFHCQWGGVGTDAHLYNVTTFNHYLVKRINAIVSCLDLEKKMAKFNCMHYMPQYLYYDRSNVTTTHILSFEHLTEEFNRLMMRYDLPMRMNDSESSSKVNHHTHVFTQKDLLPETVQLIQKVYRQDFLVFGYDLALNATL
jgi:hypothetical protein